MKFDLQNIKALNSPVFALALPLLAACSDNLGGTPLSSSDPTLKQQSAADSNLSDVQSNPLTEDVKSFLTTGLNGDDSNSYWQCSNGVLPNSNVFPIRLFADGNGHIAETEITWQIISSDRMEFNSDLGLTVLADIEIESHETPSFTATDEFDVEVECSWAGETRHSQNQIFNDEIESGDFFTGESTYTSFSCSHQFTNNSAIGLTLELDSNSTGSFNGASMRWYTNDHRYLYISTEDALHVFADFSKAFSNEEIFLGFNATYLGESLECLSI